MGGSAVGGDIVDLLHLDVKLGDIKSDCHLERGARAGLCHRGDKGYRRAEGKLNANCEVACCGREGKWRQNRFVATMIRVIRALGGMKKLTIQ